MGYCFLMLFVFVIFVRIRSAIRRKKAAQRTIEIQWEIVHRAEEEGRWEEAAEIREMLNPNIYK